MNEVKIRFRKENHQPSCNHKKLEFQYKQGSGPFESLKYGEEYTITQDGLKDVTLRAYEDEGNKELGEVFCINGLTKDNLKAEWKVEGDKKEWTLSWKNNSTNTIELVLLEGYKMKIRINYPTDSNSGTHILCKKEQGKTLHALGPVDLEDKPQDSAEIQANESEKIHCVGVKGSKMARSNIFIEKDNVGGDFMIKQIGDEELKLMWEITLIEADNRNECKTPKESNYPNLGDPEANVTMGVDEPVKKVEKENKKEAEKLEKLRDLILTVFKNAEHFKDA